MSLHQFRPRFRLQVPLQPKEVLDRLNQLIQDPQAPCTGHLADLQGHVDLQLPEKDRHTWSPTMGINVEERDGGTLLRVLIGPNPGIWTAVMFSALGLITGIMFLLILGSVQLFLDKSAWAFTLVAIFTVLLIGVWMASRVGAKLAFPQTQQLRQILESVLQD
jgi:hypothetical protein